MQLEISKDSIVANGSETVALVPQESQLLRKCFMRGGAVILALAICITFVPSARGDAVVTLCHASSEAGPGVNLETALLAKPDPNTLINSITFQCNGSATIQVREVFINQPTSIDGANQITFANAPGNSFMFVVNGTFFYLNNLILQNTGVHFVKCTTGCGGSVVFGVAVSPTVELHHCAVQNSITPIAMQTGSLNVFDSQFTGNKEGVIVAAGTTSVVRSTFQNNSGAAPIGGTGTVSISDSQFVNNGATVLLGTCKVTIDRSTFKDNTFNGALSLSCDSTISHSVFTNNASNTFGGAILFDFGASQITLRADQFTNNSAGSLFGGGAVYWRPPAGVSRTLTVVYSAFKGNKAAGGGAIAIDDSINFTGRTIVRVGVTSFSQNTASAYGGAIRAASSELQIARGAFADNSAAGSGGAVFLSNASALHSVFANTLFVRNHALTGSAFFGDDADFINSTVDSNVGSAIVIAAPRTPVHIRFKNSIVSNNPQGGCVPTASFDDASPGHNLQYPGADCGPTITVANPHLDTMYIPLPQSPPMGNGDLNTCMSPPVSGRDVYGIGRPAGGACTIGAAESDIQVLVSRHTPKRRGGVCDCGESLLKALQRFLQSFSSLD
jgi:predicted outer membrane repeat protein